MGNVQTAASAHEVLWRQAPGGELVDLGRPHRVPLGQLRLQRAPKDVLRRREAIVLGVLALLVHGAVIYWVNQQPTTVLPIVPPEIPPMTIEFSRPAPPVVEPPPPQPVQPVVEPPPPVEDELAVKPPPPKPVPKPKPVAKPLVKPAPKAVEQPPVPPQPVAPVAAPAPPAPPAPAPVTPASATAGYLKTRRRNTRRWPSVKAGKARCCCACMCWPAASPARSSCRKAAVAMHSTKRR